MTLLCLQSNLKVLVKCAERLCTREMTASNWRKTSIKRKNVKKRKNNKQNEKKKSIQCYRCKQYGHYKMECHEKDQGNIANNAAQTNNNDDVALMTFEKENMTKELWIADTGASTHMCKSVDGFENIKKTNQTIRVGNSQQMKSFKMGTWRGVVVMKNGTWKTILLDNMIYVPNWRPIYCWSHRLCRTVWNSMEQVQRWVLRKETQQLNLVIE